MQTQLSPHQLLDHLVAILPGFAARWEDSGNLFRDEDGSFSHCGVFTECSHYFRDEYARLTEAHHRNLALFVNDCMQAESRELSEAAATCFLENLAFEPLSENFEQHLTGEALKYYRDFRK